MNRYLVRRAALLAWSVTFALLPTIGVALFVIETGGGMMVDPVRTV